MLDLDHTFTAADVAREAIRLASNNPKAVYVGPDGWGFCYYTRGEAGGAQGCLFGQALRNLGVENLDQLEPSEGGLSTGVVPLLRQLGIEVSCHDATCLTDAQSRQDKGHRWSVAVEPLAEMVGGTNDAE